jgi:phage shock protein A
VAYIKHRIGALIGYGLMIRPPAPGYCRLTLRPDLASAGALDLILGAHARLLGWLDMSVPPGHPADLVALHRTFYEAARAASGLPARSVTLAFKDWVRRRRGELIEGLPLDEKLYAIKGIESVSIATLSGRVTVPFRVEDYGRGWLDPAPARLLKGPNGFELMVSTDEGMTAATLTKQEETMSATESALKRIGRVIAGMTNLAVDAAEGVNPEAVIAQAIREIDAAADEVRTDLGKATAERHRLDSRRQQLLREKAELDARVRVALDANRDDLAEVGIARQIDIEAQVGVLDRLLVETDEKIAQLGQTVDAVAASRREAEQTRKDYLASQADHVVPPDGRAVGSKQAGAMTKIARAQAATTRVTGVPASPAKADSKALGELADLERDREVKSRLARLKSGRNA